MAVRSCMSKIWVYVPAELPLLRSEENQEGMVAWKPSDWKVKIFKKGVISHVTCCWHDWGVTTGLSNMGDIVTLMQTFSLVTVDSKENRMRSRNTEWRQLFEDLLTICYCTKWVVKESFITREKPSLSSGCNCFWSHGESRSLVI